MNPYQPPSPPSSQSPTGHQPLPDWSATSGLVISESQQLRLREMVRKSIHPARIDELLIACGALSEQLEHTYGELNLRRSHLLDRYRMNRNVRIVGAIIVLCVAGLAFVNRGQVPVVISLGLIAYGLALVISGNLKVGLPSEPKKNIPNTLADPTI